MLFKIVLRKFKKNKELFDNIKSRLFYQKFDRSRRAFITSSTIALTTYLFTSSALGMLRRDRWELTKRSITIPGIPPGLKGTRIVLFSDIHSGPFMSYPQMREYCEIINNLNADLILIPGDFTDTKKSEIKAFNLAFRDVKAKYGIYGTLGNHDYFSDPSYISESIINETPIKMLRNNYARVDINDNSLLLLGIEDTRDSGTNNSDKLLEYLDETYNKIADLTSEFKYKIPRILLAHKPYIFEFTSKYNIDLMVSGHTHGGQIVLFQGGTLNLSIAATISKYISGYYEFNNSKLYVSRGLGTVGMPIRVNCPPEITILEFT
ncbi:MAG: metallophosphoesterase [Ignavibacteria bacterium]